MSTNASDYRKLYEQEWVESPADRKLFDLAMEYHRRCELFDRTVCRYRDEHGTAMPTDQYEIGRVNRNAQQIIREIVDREGTERTELMRAINRHARDFDPRSLPTSGEGA